MNYYDPRFNGTAEYHRFNPFTRAVCTDSVIHFATEKKAFWLLDVIASYIATKTLDPEDFSVIFCDTKKGTAVVYAKLDTGEPDLFRQKIQYTDLDVSVKLYLTNNVLMFPSDY